MDEEDEELQRALALSREEFERPRPGRDVTPGSEDDDEEARFQRELEIALEASKADAVPVAPPPIAAPVASMQRSSAAKSDPPSNPPSEVPTPLPQAEAMSSFLTERAKMEQERLERIAKRMRGEEASGSLQREEPPAKRPRPSTSSSVQPKTISTLDKIKQAEASAEELAARMNVTSSPSIPSGSKTTFFWDGELRQTANRLVDKEKDTRPTFRFSEVIGPKSEIAFAILSSYSNMFPWINEFFDPNTPVVLVNQPREDGNSRVDNLPFPNWIVTMPFLRGGRGSMHVKLIMLFYKDGRLRIAIPTANFIDYDWRDIENSCWVQDIPARQTPIRHDAKATDFPATLQRVLQSLNVPAALKKHIDGDHPNLPIESIIELRMNWDWSKVNVRLVASLAGKHEGWDQVLRTGHPALMRAVQSLGARAGKSKDLTMECQGSSIGSYSTQWMNEFFCSARGESATTWLDKPKSQRSRLPWPAVRLVYPSHQTVKDSVLGFPGGGTMFCRSKQWEARTFPKELFYDSNSKRGRVLMHSKMIVGTLLPRSGYASPSKGKGRPVDSEDEDTDNELEITNSKNESVLGWAYIGSHNFTPSAWGTLSGSSSKPILNITNYELGIVVPLHSLKEADDIACWKRPPRKYVTGKDRPWMQDEVTGTAVGNWKTTRREKNLNLNLKFPHILAVLPAGPFPTKSDTLASRIFTRWIQTFKASSLGEEKCYEDFYRCSTHRWLFNEAKNFELRYVKFNVPAIQAIAAQAVGANECTFMEKIAEGSFNKIFCLRFDNNAEVIVRIPCPIVGNTRLAVASEAATLTYAREHLHVPVPKVLASSRRREHYNDIGAEFLVLEKAQGVPLHRRIDSLNGDEAKPFIKDFLGIESRISSYNFSQIGSLYFKEDVTPELQNRPLFANGSAGDSASEKYRIGPTVQRDFWRGERRYMNIDRGPWPDFGSYIQAIINRERQWLKTYAKPRPKNDPLFLSDFENDPDTHLRLLDCVESIIPCLNLPPSFMDLKLSHPDLNPSNVLVTPDGYPKVTDVIDWQHASILPYFVQAVFPPTFLYQGALISMKEDGEQEEMPDSVAAEPPEVQAKYQNHLQLVARHKLFHKMVRENDRRLGRLHVMGSPIQKAFLGLLQHASRSWTDGAYGIREQLMELYYDWDIIAGPGAPYPISFSEEEMGLHDVDSYNGDYRTHCRYVFLEKAGCNPDGLVEAEKYEQVKAFCEKHHKDWVPERMGPWPLQDGTWSSLL